MAKEFGAGTSCGKMPGKSSKADKVPHLAGCDDGELIQMALAGRNDCFSQLMDRHLGAVKKHLRIFVSNEADLDDLLQEVSLKAWLRLATFRSESNIRTWMISIGINQARQEYRRRKRKPISQALDDFAGFASPAESPHQQLLRAEATQAVRSAVAKLPPQYREVVVLRDLNELGGKEIADRLRITVSAVKTRLFRARMVLSTKMRRRRAFPLREQTPSFYGAARSM